MQPFERWRAWLFKPWMHVSCLWLIVCSYVYLDRPLAIYFHHLDLQQTCPMVYWITCLGVTEVYLVVLPVIAIAFFYVLHQKTAAIRACFLWLCLVFPSILALGLKPLLGRARPELLFSHQRFGWYGWHLNEAFFSFPSGHVTAITSLMIGLTLLFPRYRYVFIIIALLVISTRVALTYHYLSDVLASAYLVWLELGVLFYVVRRRYPNVWGLVWQ